MLNHLSTISRTATKEDAKYATEDDQINAVDPCLSSSPRLDTFSSPDDLFLLDVPRFKERVLCEGLSSFSAGEILYAVFMFATDTDERLDVHFKNFRSSPISLDQAETLLRGEIPSQIGPDKLKRIARSLFSWILQKDSEVLTRFFVERTEAARVQLIVKEETVIELARRGNYPVIRVLLELKVYTLRRAQNEKINVDALFFLDLMHGLVTVGQEKTFIKRLEKEDMVAMLLAADFSQNDVIQFVEMTCLELALC